MLLADVIILVDGQMIAQNLAPLNLIDCFLTRHCRCLRQSHKLHQLLATFVVPTAAVR